MGRTGGVKAEKHDIELMKGDKQKAREDVCAHVGGGEKGEGLPGVGWVMSAGEMLNIKNKKVSISSPLYYY